MSDSSYETVERKQKNKRSHKAHENTDKIQSLASLTETVSGASVTESNSGIPPNTIIPVRTFWDEIALQIGIFLSVVTGFIAAQLWYTAIDSFVSKQKVDKEDNYYVWSYAIILTIVAVIIMSLWGYYVVLKRRNQ